MRLSPRTFVLALVVFALSGWTWWEGRGPAAREVGPLVPGVLDARRIALSQGAESVLLVKDDDDTWGVETAQGFPAFADGVDRLLRQLAGVTTADLAAESESSHEELGVGADAVRITIDGGIALVAGSTAGATYVRLAEGPHVLRAATLTVPAVSNSVWIEAQPFLFDPSRPTGLRLAHPDDDSKVLHLERIGDGRWAAEGGGTLAPALVTDWLRSVSNLVVEDVLPRELWDYGGPTRECAIQVRDGDEVLTQFELYARDEGWRAWMSETDCSTADHLVVVPTASAERIQNGLRALFAAVQR